MLLPRRASVYMVTLSVKLGVESAFGCSTS